MSPFKHCCFWTWVRLLSGILVFVSPGYSQISLSSSVSLALSNDPRMRMAESDAARARATLPEAKPAFIPSVTGSTGGAGYSYGFPLGVPTIFTFSAQSLIFSFSQLNYIRAAREGLNASDHDLDGVRDDVFGDTAAT